MTLDQTSHSLRSSHKVHQWIHFLQRHAVASRHMSVRERLEEESSTHADFDFGEMHANADCIIFISWLFSNLSFIPENVSRAESWKLLK